MKKRSVLKTITLSLLMATVFTCMTTTVSFAKTEKSLSAKKLDNYKEVAWEVAHSVAGHTYVNYQWREPEGKSSKGISCVERTVKNGKIVKKKIPMNKKTKAFFENNEYEWGSEWKDSKGNFFCITGKTKKGKYYGYCIKINKKGKITKKISLNEWLKVHQKSNSYYNLEVERIEKNTVICKYEDYKYHGYVLLDRNTGKVKEQLVGSDRSLYPYVYTSKALVVYNPWKNSNRILIAPIPKKKTITLSSGKKIKYAKLKKYKAGEEIPQEEGQILESFAAYHDDVYLLTAAGYYKIDVDDGSYKKIASTQNIDFFHEKYTLDTQEGNVAQIFPVSDKKFIMRTGYKDYEDPEYQYKHLWVVKVK